ncbi:NupC/NupG family nucleoside CNT transporter [Williamsia sterculiae]|uniref:Nucleoside transport protein n=1 Tax=Williamsia sterculiae TaxID=1344003 RepID=A0A1N7FRC4_9NOCA|nr:nucleoside transporter C-terminal domain-containing protein [Williamsia sterculiae]SIS02912.1 nucleoside transport protein [Williamsia sterculiae]
MHILIGVIGLVVFLVLAWAPSTNRALLLAKLPWVALLLAIEFVLALVMLKTGVGESIVNGISSAFTRLLQYAGDGTKFVFGDLMTVGADSDTGAPFLLTVLMPIVFISALIGILQYIGVLPLIIKYLGLLLSKVNGLGELESYNAVASALLGQSEVFISVKKLLPHIPPQRMYTLAASAMSTVSASILGAYIQLIEPRYVIAAILLNLFGAFIVVSLLNPYTVTREEDAALLAAGAETVTAAEQQGDGPVTGPAQQVAAVPVADEELGRPTLYDRWTRLLRLPASARTGKRQSFFEMLAEYILDGFKVAITVAAMLIGFIALISLLNGIFSGLFHGTTFQDVLGHVFSPLAYLTGIPWHECVRAGEFMATKLVTNEVVAMTQLRSASDLSPRTTAIVSTFLVSFANFSSIGIIAGAVRSLDGMQGRAVARFGLRLLYGATLVSFISATIVGLIS